MDVTIHEDVPSLTQKVKEISLKEDINPPKAAFDQGKIKFQSTYTGNQSKLILIQESLLVHLPLPRSQR